MSLSELSRVWFSSGLSCEGTLLLESGLNELVHVHRSAGSCLKTTELAASSLAVRGLSCHFVRPILDCYWIPVRVTYAPAHLACSVGDQLIDCQVCTVIVSYYIRSPMWPRIQKAAFLQTRARMCHFPLNGFFHDALGDLLFGTINPANYATMAFPAHLH